MTRAPSMTPRNHVCLQFMEKLQELQESAHFCDLTIELKNEKFTAHRLVLSAWSPLVFNLISDGLSGMDTIRLQYDKGEVFSSFLSFLYTCELNEVAEQNLIQILHLATSLQVNGLRQVCEDMLKTQVKISNIISTFHIARKFRLPNLEEYALAYMQMNLPDAVKQADFLSLSPPKFNSFLSSGWVCVMKPEVKLFLIISWLGYDVKERQQYLVLLLKYIDWSTVANDFLTEISQTENFFTTNESSLYLLLQSLFSSTIPLGPYEEVFPALRKKYAYLLDHIVQNSYVLPFEAEEYCSMSVQLVTLPQPAPQNQTAVTASESEPNTEVIWDGSGDLSHSIEAETHHELCNIADVLDLSNDSVADNIGLQMRNVAIMESRCADKVMLSGCAVLSACREEDPCPDDNVVGETELGHLTHSPLSLSNPKPTTSSKTPGRSAQKRTKSGRYKQKITVDIKTEKIDENSNNRTTTSEKTDKIVETTHTDTTTAQAKPLNKNVSPVIPDPEHGKPGTVCCVQPTKRSKRKAAVNWRISRSAKRDGISSGGNNQEPETDDTTAVDDPEQSIRACDSDIDEGGHEELPKDNDKNDPDYDLPVKRTRSSRIKHNVSNLVKPKVNVVNTNSTKSMDKASNKITTMKLKTEQSLMENTTDPDSAVPTKQEADVNKNEGRVSRDIGRKRKCDKCDYSASTQHRLDNHMERVHGNRATVYACCLCQFECQWSKSFFDHMKQHFQGPPYLCDSEDCDWETDKISDLLSHRRRHTDERPFKCSQCNARFRTRNNLIAHFKCHSESKDHECPVCQRRFKMKNTMEQHLVTHSDHRPYLCDTCGFSTKFQTHLISHKRIHTGEVFHCNFINCTYSCPKRSQLKAHMRSHLNIRHHTCDTCQKSFVEKSHLVRHQKIHQGVRPHKCDQCKYSSTRVDKLNEHKRKCHSEDAAKKKQQPRKENTSQRNRLTKSSTPQSSMVLYPVIFPGPPIRPKQVKNIQMKPTIATLVSAAEELGLADLTEPVHTRQKGKNPVRKKKSKKSETQVGKRKVKVTLHSSEDTLVQDLTPAVSSTLVGLQTVDLNHPDHDGKGTQNVEPVSNQDQPAEASQVQDVGGVSQEIYMDTVGLQTPLYTSPHHMLSSVSSLQHLAVSSHVTVSQKSVSDTVSIPETLVSQTALCDLEAVPQDVLSSLPQHNAATVSAADSLASLSFGYGSQGMGQQCSDNPQRLVPVTGGNVGEHIVNPVQLSVQSILAEEATDDCAGLKVFFQALT